MSIIHLAAAVVAFLALATSGPARAENAGTAAPTVGFEGTLKAWDKTKANVAIVLPSPSGAQALDVKDPAAEPVLAKAQPGDAVRFTANDRANPTQLTKL